MTFCVLFFALLAALVAFFLAAEAAFLVLPSTEPLTFVADSLTLVAAFAAARVFLATATESPAFCRDLGVDLASLAIESIFADANFLAVAAPTPGSEVKSLGDEGALAAIIPLLYSSLTPDFNLPPVAAEPQSGFFMAMNLLVWAWRRQH